MSARVTVRLFHELRTSLGQSEIQLQADTLNDVIQSLIAKSEAVRDVIFDQHGKLRGYTTFYINNAAVNPPNLTRKLKDGDLVILVPTAAGG